MPALGLSLSLPSCHAVGGGGVEPRTLYYNDATADNDWNTLGNWWNDSGHTDAAASLPANGDSVVISASVSVPPATPLTLVAVTVTDGTVDLEGVTSFFTFSGTSAIRGEPVGDALFSDSATLVAGFTLTGNAEFTGTSQLLGTVIGDANFADASVLDGSATVTGNALFEDDASQLGTVQGDSTYVYPHALPATGTTQGSIVYEGYVFGCRDEGATNYNPAANADSVDGIDGTESCTYD
jgi:hypothetical protein